MMGGKKMKEKLSNPKYSDAILHIWRTFNKNNGPLWATSLTYTTLFALVPLFAVALSLFKVFGGFEQVQKIYLFPLISEMLDPTQKIEVMRYIQGFVDQIDAGVLGIMGTFVFLLTFIPLFMTIERSINVIWGRKDDRPLWIKFAIYWAIATLGPLVIVTAMITLSVLTQYIPALSFLEILKPFVLILIIFSLFIIYKLIPNTEVRNKPALVGAVTGGLLWIIASLLYQNYMEFIAGTITIYGSLGAIPIFLLWIYLNWFIMLLGAQISRYAQYPGKTYISNPAILFRASIDILKTLSSHVTEGTYLKEPKLDKITLYPPEIVSKVIDGLRSADLVLIKGDIILPAKPLSAIKPSDLMRIFIGDIKGDAFKGIDLSKPDEVTLADIT
jgi:membrane protein